MQFRVNFSDNISIIYSLINDKIVDDWKKIIETVTVNELCPHNNYIGYVDKTIFESRLSRLYELADLINIHSPEKIIKTDINKFNYKHALNTMHVHFPLLKNDIKYKHIWDSLTEYNDHIHWIESSIHNYYNNNSSSSFRITLDFNKSGVQFNNIPDHAYKLFDPHTLFGELKLHYTHVGRHAQELFLTNDFTCPKDQFIPQRSYTASVRMYFTDDYYVNFEKWKSFYKVRGKDFWSFDIDDPKLAFGYIKIGELEKIVVNNEDIPIPKDYASRHIFRNKLSATKILNWEII